MISHTVRLSLIVTPLLALHLHAGELTPSGAPASTPGPEPRIAVSATNTPGNAEATYVIAQPGSHYLAENLVGESGRHGIAIEAPNVTLDLNGFTVQGVPGSVSGIVVSNETLLRGIRISNGTVSDWNSYGVIIEGTDGAQIEGIVAVGNGAAGFLGGGATLVPDSTAASLVSCTAVSNEDSGFSFSITRGTVMQGCVARDNGADGFTLGREGLLVNCLALQNVGRGYLVNPDSLISHCIATDNGSEGIHASSMVDVTECVANSNGSHGILAAIGGSVTGCSAISNTGSGIVVTRNSRICNNQCSYNDEAGILVEQGHSHIEGNSVMSNETGIDVNGTENLIIRNTATDNTTDYDIITGNAVGPVYDATGIDINLTNPYRNLQY